MAVIAVGVDGSESAAAALRWAAAEARLRGARLRVVHAWNVPTIAHAGSGFVPPASFEDDLGQAAETALGQWLDAAKADLEGLEVGVTPPRAIRQRFSSTRRPAPTS
jgi:nucleotide-binding universal stress UspA family protein